MNDFRCDTCQWGEKFKYKRPDEPTEWGCRKLNWEGYTDPERPACGGVFWMPIPERDKHEDRVGK